MEWRIKWQQCPRVQNPSKVLFVEAETQADAGQVAREHIERKYGCGWFVVDEVKVYERVATGKVISG